VFRELSVIEQKYHVVLVVVEDGLTQSRPARGRADRVLTRRRPLDPSLPDGRPVSSW
jgi:hypothetical protein